MFIDWYRHDRIELECHWLSMEAKLNNANEQAQDLSCMWSKVERNFAPSHVGADRSGRRPTAAHQLPVSRPRPYALYIELNATLTSSPTVGPFVKLDAAP